MRAPGDCATCWEAAAGSLAAPSLPTAAACACLWGAAAAAPALYPACSLLRSPHSQAQPQIKHHILFKTLPRIRGQARHARRRCAGRHPRTRAAGLSATARARAAGPRSSGPPPRACPTTRTNPWCATAIALPGSTDLMLWSCLVPGREGTDWEVRAAPVPPAAAVPLQPPPPRGPRERSSARSPLFRAQATCALPPRCGVPRPLLNPPLT